MGAHHGCALRVIGQGGAAEHPENAVERGRVSAWQDAMTWVGGSQGKMNLDRHIREDDPPVEIIAREYQ